MRHDYRAISLSGWGKVQDYASVPALLFAVRHRWRLPRKELQPVPASDNGLDTAASTEPSSRIFATYYPLVSHSKQRQLPDTSAGANSSPVTSRRSANTSQQTRTHTDAEATKATWKLPALVFLPLQWQLKKELTSA